VSEFRAIVQPIRAPKTGELVAAQIRRQIVRGDLAEGDALASETELMELYGVSRPTLREAFRVLESEGLIIVRRGARGGARVRLPDVSVAGRHLGLLLQLRGTTLDDVFAARVVIEPAAARQVAERTPEQGRETALARLHDAVDAEAMAVDDPATFAALSARFHAMLVSVSGNDTLALLAEALDEVIVASTEHAVAQSRRLQDQQRSNRRAVSAHRKLLRLIDAGDAEGAESYWRTHMEAVRKRFADLYGVTTVVELLT
jgi:DNA-binding FadR family transcriptional regulator